MPAALLVSCIVVAAAWMVTHVALVVGCMTATDLPARDRWLSLVPPLAPVFGWRVGRRRTVVVWACLIALYVLLRAVLAAR